MSMVQAAALSSTWGPLAGQIYVQVSYTAMILMTRVALAGGMSNYYYVMYRQIGAALTVCPLAFVLQRSEGQMFTKIKARNLGQIFLLSLLGIAVGQNLYYAGLAYTYTTFVSTINNLNPAVTFVMAYFLGLEEVKVRSRRGQAKVLGTLLCVGGATVMTLVKGGSPPAPSPSTSTSTSTLTLLLGGTGSWILGVFLVCTGSWMWSAFLIYQARVAGEYPSQLWLSALVCFMGTLQSTALAFSLDSPTALLPHWDFHLLVVTYSGIFCSGLGFFAIMWCVKERGPVYTAAFNPLSTVLVAILEPLLLHVHLHWGSLIGMVTVIGGLYCVLWGKAKDGEAGRALDLDQEPLLASTSTTNQC